MPRECEMKKMRQHEGVAQTYLHLLAANDDNARHKSSIPLPAWEQNSYNSPGYLKVPTILSYYGVPMGAPLMMHEHLDVNGSMRRCSAGASMPHHVMDATRSVDDGRQGR